MGVLLMRKKTNYTVDIFASNFVRRFFLKANYVYIFLPLFILGHTVNCRRQAVL